MYSTIVKKIKQNFKLIWNHLYTNWMYYEHFRLLVNSINKSIRRIIRFKLRKRQKRLFKKFKWIFLSLYIFIFTWIIIPFDFKFWIIALYSLFTPAFVTLYPTILIILFLLPVLLYLYMLIIIVYVILSFIITIINYVNTNKYIKSYKFSNLLLKKILKVRKKCIIIVKKIFFRFYYFAVYYPHFFVWLKLKVFLRNKYKYRYIKHVKNFLFIYFQIYCKIYGPFVQYAYIFLSYYIFVLLYIIKAILLLMLSGLKNFLIDFEKKKIYIEFKIVFKNIIFSICDFYGIWRIIPNSFIKKINFYKNQNYFSIFLECVDHLTVLTYFIFDIFFFIVYNCIGKFKWTDVNEIYENFLENVKFYIYKNYNIYIVKFVRKYIVGIILFLYLLNFVLNYQMIGVCVEENLYYFYISKRKHFYIPIDNFYYEFFKLQILAIQCLYYKLTVFHYNLTLSFLNVLVHFLIKLHFNILPEFYYQFFYSLFIPFFCFFYEYKYGCYAIFDYLVNFQETYFGYIYKLMAIILACVRIILTPFLLTGMYVVQLFVILLSDYAYKISYIKEIYKFHYETQYLIHKLNYFGFHESHFHPNVSYLYKSKKKIIIALNHALPKVFFESATECNPLEKVYLLQFKLYKCTPYYFGYFLYQVEICKIWLTLMFVLISLQETYTLLYSAQYNLFIFFKNPYFFIIIIIILLIITGYILIKKFNFKINLFVNLIFIFCAVITSFVIYFFYYVYLPIETYYFSQGINFNFSINFVFMKVQIFNLYFDFYNIFLTTMVFVIYFFSLLYSYFYLKSDQNRLKFSFFLSIFAFSMIILICSNNIILTFICWEIIGISSFFLIGHYHYKISNFKSALKAMFFNQFSDIIFIFIIILHYKLFNNFLIINNFEICNEIYINLWFFSLSKVNILLILITLICFIKSAQFFFSIWLLDSMDAPVPASALIHSATLVIAGIVLMFKYKYLFMMCPNLIQAISIFATITAIVSSISACYQTDLKKLLACSTINNCSILILFVLLSNNYTFILYTILHGFVKSELFLIFGVIFLINSHKQDLNYFKNFISANLLLMQIIYCLLGVLSSVPIIFTFDIKHSIFDQQVFYNVVLNNFIYYGILISTVFSFIYGLKLIININSIKYFNSGKKNSLNHSYTNLYKNLILIVILYFIFILLYIFIVYKYFNFVIFNFNSMQFLFSELIYNYIYILTLIIAIIFILSTQFKDWDIYFLLLIICICTSMMFV